MAELSAQADELGPVIVQTRFEYVETQLAALRDASSEADQQRRQSLEAAYAVAKSRADTLGTRPELVFETTGSDLQGRSGEFKSALANLGRRSSRDDEIWALVIAIITAVVLAVGRYGFIQTFSTVLVASFTFITVVNVIMLQNNDFWAATWGDIANGMSFRLPPPPPGALKATGVATALATFGIIGVGGQRVDCLSLLVFGEGLCTVYRTPRQERSLGRAGSGLDAGDALGRLVLDGRLYLCHVGVLLVGSGHSLASGS